MTPKKVKRVVETETVTIPVHHHSAPGWVFDVTFDEDNRVTELRIHLKEDAFWRGPDGAISDDPDAFALDERELLFIPKVLEGPGITARWMRTLPFGDITALARRQIEWAYDHQAEMAERYAGRPSPYRQDLDELLAERERWAQRFLDRPGSRGRPRREYAQVAVDYDAVIEAGGEAARRPVDELARRYNLAATTVRNLVARAREEGFLTRTARGTAGGRATAEAFEALEAEE